MKCPDCSKKMRLVQKLGTYHVQTWEYRCECGKEVVKRVVF